MIIQADILEWCNSYQGEPFHAALLDPPYHLTEITKRFGNPNAAPAQYGKDGAFQRASKGFMGKQWDGGDIAFRPETWAALGQHLHPGAFGMAFASTRGLHRMATAIEGMVSLPVNQIVEIADLLALARATRNWDLVEEAELWLRSYIKTTEAIRAAGFIIHPTIMCWTFLSGFPKATAISPQIDRMAGVERPVIGQRAHAPKFAAAEFGYREKDNGYNSRERESFDVTGSGTPLAAAWEGHRYGLQALKPALEPIIVFQKPYQGKPVENIARTGAGALNIDQARIGTGGQRQWAHARGMGFSGGTDNGPCESVNSESGRWPSNLVLAHHPACTADHCDASCPVRRMGEQSGVTSSTKLNCIQQPRTPHAKGSERERIRVDEGYIDSGTAARMFYNADYMYERLEAADPASYHPKASTSEREAGLGDFDPTTVNDGRQTPIDNAYQRGETSRRNIHPTIKPISLAKYLASLLLPPIDYAPRRLLIPFAGAGSEMIGAHLAGWEDVTGIELEAEHVRIGRARLDFWQNAARRLMTTDPETILRMQDEGSMPNLIDLMEAA